MKKLPLLILITLFSFSCYSQIIFENGYFIDNQNQIIECLIKNEDWAINPNEIKYKLSEEAEQKTLTIKSIKEFGIYGVSKYIRCIVDIDRSSQVLSKITFDKYPKFMEEELFLKILVEGKATLYLYEDGNYKKFFFNKDNSKIKQLIFKNYKISTFDISQNNTFKQQLWINLTCQDIKMDDIKTINYKQNELVNLFERYNQCLDVKFINYDTKPKKKSI